MFWYKPSELLSVRLTVECCNAWYSLLFCNKSAWDVENMIDVIFTEKHFGFWTSCFVDFSIGFASRLQSGLPTPRPPDSPGATFLKSLATTYVNKNQCCWNETVIWDLVICCVGLTGNVVQWKCHFCKICLICLAN